MFTEKINPFDLLSGKVVQNSHGIFWFKESGNNMKGEHPIRNRLHRDNDLPAVMRYDGQLVWCKDGKTHRLSGPAITWLKDEEWWWVDDEEYFSKEEFNKAVNEYKQRNKPI